MLLSRLMLTLDKVLNYSCSYLMATSWTEDHFLLNVSLHSLGLSCYIQRTFTCQGVININEKHSSRMRTARLPTVSCCIPGPMSRGGVSTNPPRSHVWGGYPRPPLDIPTPSPPLDIPPGYNPPPPIYPPYWTYPPRHTHLLDVPFPRTYPSPGRGLVPEIPTPSPKTTRYQRYQPPTPCVRMTNRHL